MSYTTENYLNSLAPDVCIHPTMVDIDDEELSRTVCVDCSKDGEFVLEENVTEEVTQDETEYWKEREDQEERNHLTDQYERGLEGQYV